MLNPFASRDDRHLLVISMIGVRMGDRFVQVGCADEARLAGLAGKVGLSGRAVAVVPDEASASRAAKGAERAGVLLEIQIAPPTQLPVEEGSFDIAVVDDTLGLVSSTAASVEALVREIRRVLRPAGRAVFVGGSQKRGLRASFRRQSAPPFVASGEAGAALQSGGFSAVRTVGECEQLVFVEGIAPRAAP